MKNLCILKKIYSKDYFILIGIAFLPLMWKILEVVLLASFDNALKILGQIALISIIFKIFEETLLNPLFKLLNKNDYKDKDSTLTIAKSFIKYYFILSSIFTIVIFLFLKPIMQISMIPNYIFDETLSFLKIYTVSLGIGVLSKYLLTFNIINKDTKRMFIYLLIKSLITALLFTITVPFIGVNGIALSELIVNILTIIYFMFTFPQSVKHEVDFNVKEYFKLSLFAFLETFIRNIIYYFVILVFINMLDNQDLYFVSNEYIWSIMLVPTLAQSTLIKQEIANNKNYSLKPYFINSIFLILFMFILLPMGFLLFKYVYNLNYYYMHFTTLLKLFPCYIIFVIDSIIEAYFITTGKLHHILIQNLLTNIGVYLTALILYSFEVWTITLNSIVLLFNLGVIVSSVYTISIYLIMQNKKKKLSSLL